MAKRCYHDIIVYLDDFLVIRATFEDCKQKYDVLLSLLQDLGFTFLGVQLDTIACTLMLPAEKLQEFQTLVTEFRSKHRATQRQLQRLVGKLNWPCRVVYGGRTILRRILDLTNAMTGSAKQRLSGSFHQDILWWDRFLDVFN